MFTRGRGKMQDSGRVRTLGPVTYMVCRPFPSGEVPDVMVELPQFFAIPALIK